jgi:hypothetical protein
MTQGLYFFRREDYIVIFKIFKYEIFRADPAGRIP